MKKVCEYQGYYIDYDYEEGEEDVLKCKLFTNEGEWDEYCYCDEEERNNCMLYKYSKYIEEKDKEIERLNKEIDRLNETNIVLEDSTNYWYHIVEELEKTLQNEIERTETLIQDDFEHGLGSFGNIRKMFNEERKFILDKIKELKGSDRQ